MEANGTRTRAIAEAAGQIANEIADKGGAGRKTICRVLDDSFGNKRWETGDAHEACETATTLFVLRHAAAMRWLAEDDPARMTKMVRRLAQAEPRIRGRSERHTRDQHHATAIGVAHAMATAAAIGAGDDVADPSAGTGTLLAMAALARAGTNGTGRLRATEIDPTRAALLGAMAPAIETRRGDALADKGHAADGENDVVLLNPPFSARYGERKRYRNEDLRHLAAARRHARPGGRIAALIGGGTQLREKAWETHVAGQLRLVWAVRIESGAMENREIAATAWLCLLEHREENDSYQPERRHAVRNAEDLTIAAADGRSAWNG